MIAASAIHLILLALAPFGVQADFKVICPSFANAYIDPLIDPGQRGSHMHAIAGSTGFGTHTDAAAMNSHPTTCDVLGDHSNYWAPSLYYTGGGKTVLLEPLITSYYTFRKTDVGKIPIDALTRPFSMLVGSADSAFAQNDGKVKFMLVGASGGAQESSKWFPASAQSVEGVTIQYEFPTCWNGGAFKKDNSHMAYANSNGNCPASHPKVIPKVKTALKYRFQKQGRSISWSGGAPFFLSKGVKPHADATLLWHRDTIDALLHQCQGHIYQCHATARQSKTAGSQISRQYNVPAAYK